MPGAPGGRNQFKTTQKVCYFFLDYITTTTTTTRVLLLFKMYICKTCTVEHVGEFPLVLMSGSVLWSSRLQQLDCKFMIHRTKLLITDYSQINYFLS